MLAPRNSQLGNKIVRDAAHVRLCRPHSSDLFSAMKSNAVKIRYPSGAPNTRRNGSLKSIRNMLHHVGGGRVSVGTAAAILHSLRIIKTETAERRRSETNRTHRTRIPGLRAVDDRHSTPSMRCISATYSDGTIPSAGDPRVVIFPDL